MATEKEMMRVQSYLSSFDCIGAKYDDVERDIDNGLYNFLLGPRPASKKKLMPLWLRILITLGAIAFVLWLSTLLCR